MGKHAHPVDRDWYWEQGFLAVAWKGYDWPSIRRGRQVYTEVFAPCHSLNIMTFLHFQQFMTKEEIKKLASNYEIVDSNPDDEGLPVTRAGKPTDDLPKPYPNQQAAKFANGGALPPDLSTVAFGKEGGINYVFSLLTGYHWGGDIFPIPPFAPQLKPGQFWNPYMVGGVIGMPPPLSDGILDYEDGTPATVSQMAKDVCCFLRWSAEPDYDDRRVVFWKTQATLLTIGALMFNWQQRQGQGFSHRRILFRYWKKPF